MRVSINIFKDEQRAIRKRNSMGDDASIHTSLSGGEVFDYAEYGFSGNINQKIWVVVGLEDI
ncbi:hypothetical protein [Kordiimonas aquimaris]|uniref:hypothetical protein n=1 Tax=Kordiimonas aquimaris TaxID=707591 RepID=UPI0021D05D9F|nr:hypothetical protein [Kordiimonas aquimaris]